jgi:hypothetical protein
MIDTLKGAALIATFIGVLITFACGCPYGRTCGKPQSSPHAVQSTMPDSIALALRHA